MKKPVFWAIATIFMFTITEPIFSASSKPFAEQGVKQHWIGRKQHAANKREAGRMERLLQHRNGKFLKSKKKQDGISFPKGKLLACLVLLPLSIVFFALAGVTAWGILFNALGSIAIIAAVVFFIFWLNEKSKETKATPSN